MREVSNYRKINGILGTVFSFVFALLKEILFQYFNPYRLFTLLTSLPKMFNLDTVSNDH